MFALWFTAGASGAEESKSVSEASHGTVSTAMRHKELLTRVIPVLAFLAKHERLDQHHVMLLWDMAMPVLPASTGSAGDAEGAGAGAGAPVAAVPTSAVHSDDQVSRKGLMIALDLAAAAIVIGSAPLSLLISLFTAAAVALCTHCCARHPCAEHGHHGPDVRGGQAVGGSAGVVVLKVRETPSPLVRAVCRWRVGVFTPCPMPSALHDQRAP